MMIICISTTKHLSPSANRAQLGSTFRVGCVPCAVSAQVILTVLRTPPAQTEASSLELVLRGFLLGVFLGLFFFVLALLGLLGRLSRLLLGLLLGLLSLLHFLLTFYHGLERLNTGGVFSLVVSDEDVVKNGPRLDLPQIESDNAKVGVVVERIVVLVLRVSNLGVNPLAFVLRVIDALRREIALVFRVV